MRLRRARFTPLHECRGSHAPFGRTKLNWAKGNWKWSDFSEDDVRGTSFDNLEWFYTALLNDFESHFRDVNLENAFSLKGADLRGIIGLTKEQLEACKAKGAIIDEDSTTSSIQSTAAPLQPLQSNDVPLPSTPSAQGSLPTSDAVSSQQDSEA
jgi:uncharacterized protein YjbI with pentapeptide repeats